MTNPLITLHAHGQSFWLDNIRREWLHDGTLAAMLDARGLRGLTSNPAIFHKAITSSAAYDDQIAELAASGSTVEQIYEALVIRDIQDAADVLRPVFDSSAGADGFVSLEVSPLLAHDTARTIADGKRLFAEVDRPNVMIKVPGTPAGVPAIEELIASGVHVNVTLLFSTAQYEAAANAYIRGLERRLAAGQPVDDVASVASVFLSRIDSLVDGLISQRIVPGRKDAAEDLALESLFGEAAVASSRITYSHFQALFAGERWAPLAAAGARVQRPLWASTSTKNVLYRDVKYVEPLIGPHTVNTMPDATVEAFEDHGVVAPNTITDALERAHAIVTTLAAHGIDLGDCCQQLQDEGVDKFIEPYGELIHALESARAQAVSERQVGVSIQTGDLAGGVKKLTAALTGMRAAERLWAHDATLFGEGTERVASVANRLGWLDLPCGFEPNVARIEAFAAAVSAAGIARVVLLGMGGSSLCTEVITTLFEPRDGFPEVGIIDTTHPDAVGAVDEALDYASTLFLVASKSGGTLETLALYRYFRARAEAELGEAAGNHFVAITDPGSGLEAIAREQGFRETFLNPPDVGGRFSALSYFGLVSMALAGVSVGDVLASARELALGAGPGVPVAHQSAAQLGMLMAAGARGARPNLTIVTTPRLALLGDWLEQLIAESTGKLGHGVLPIVRDPAATTEARVTLVVQLADEADTIAETVAQLGAAPHAVVTLQRATDIGAAFFQWELATAYAGLALGVNPFDEPDVRSAKAAASAALKVLDETGSLPDAPSFSAAAITDGVAAAAEAGQYVAIMAYLPQDAANTARLESLRTKLCARHPGLVATTGFGPRLLHSIGQLYKGGPNRGLFVQIVDPVLATERRAVPGGKHDFNTLVTAQALGDHDALVAGGRTVIRVEVGDAADFDLLVAAI